MCLHKYLINYFEFLLPDYHFMEYASINFKEAMNPEGQEWLQIRFEWNKSIVALLLGSGMF